MSVHVRLTWPWLVISPSLFLVVIAYPFLVLFVEGRSLDARDVLPLGGVALVATYFLWYGSHRAVISADTVHFRSLFRSNVVSRHDLSIANVSDDWIILTDRQRRRFRVNTSATNVDALLDVVRSGRA